MEYEVYKKNGMQEVLMGVYEAKTSEEAKKIADDDINYGWYVSKVVMPGTLKKFKVTYITIFTREEDFQIVFAENEDQAKKMIFNGNEIISIEELSIVSLKENNSLKKDSQIASYMIEE